MIKKKEKKRRRRNIINNNSQQQHQNADDEQKDGKPRFQKAQGASSADSSRLCDQIPSSSKRLSAL